MLHDTGSNVKMYLPLNYWDIRWNNCWDTFTEGNTLKPLELTKT